MSSYITSNMGPNISIISNIKIRNYSSSKTNNHIMQYNVGEIKQESELGMTENER